MIPDAVLDIVSEKTTYLHVSMPDARILIFDISDCVSIGTKPNPDHTLTAWKDGEQIVLEPIRPTKP